MRHSQRRRPTASETPKSGEKKKRLLYEEGDMNEKTVVSLKTQKYSNDVDLVQEQKKENNISFVCLFFAFVARVANNPRDIRALS